MNVGPTADGRIVPLFEERLRQMGMCKVNIYRTKKFGETAIAKIYIYRHILMVARTIKFLTIIIVLLCRELDESERRGYLQNQALASPE